MIRAIVEQTFDSTKKYLVMFGLSTDTKPTSGLITGSEFHEVDTGVKYEFDEVGAAWHDVGITEQEIRDEIDAWLDAHPEATTTVEDGAISYAKLNSSLQGTVDDVGTLNTEIQNKANVDGSYSSLTAGNAEQLVSTVGVTDKTPYLFRTTGGSADVGDRVKLSEITGGTVAWNQNLKGINSTNWISTAVGTTVSFSDGVATVTAGAQYSGMANASVNRPTFANGHKIFYAAGVKLTTATVHAMRIKINGVDSKYAEASTDWQTIQGIHEWDGTKAGTFMFLDWRSSDWDAYQVKDPMFFDLTAMFGSTIADYLYTLESGTAGAGVAKLKSWGFCTAPYYAYDAGSLLSVKTSAHKTIGFNAYDNTTGKAKVVGGQVYQITGTYTALSLDGTSITPDASGYFTPAESGELTVTGGNATDTCIHLKWDGERDGEWEEYSEHTYPLDDVELRGIPKLDANNNLYYDGDSYEPDGTVERRYGIVDLSSVSMTYDGVRWQTTAIPIKAYSARSDNLMSDKWVASVSATNGSEGEIVTVNGGVYLYTSDGVNHPNGYLVYELATPTTESADPYQETQVCNDFGTEEFVDERTLKMPVCANALYQANLRAKLEMAPDSPSGNGDYIVRQTDGLNEYVLLEKELPTAPAEDGTYSLKCTVADGAATLSWVADA